jgi:hypothetical protein
MAKGNFIVSATENNQDIEFAQSPTADAVIPVDQNDLIISVESALDTLRTLYYDTNRALYNDYFDQLLKLSQLGLVGDNVQISLATRALEQIKTEIVNRESGKVKNKYLRELGGKAFWYGFPVLLAGILLKYYICKWGAACCLDYGYTGSLCLIWAGCMVGVWLSFAITRTVLGFGDLTIIEKDRLEPSIRLIFTGALSLIFGLLFIQKAITISLGQLKSDDILSSPVTAFLIGVILGLNEKIIGSTLTKKTSGLFDK